MLLEETGVSGENESQLWNDQLQGKGAEISSSDLENRQQSEDIFNASIEDYYMEHERFWEIKRKYLY